MLLAVPIGSMLAIFSVNDFGMLFAYCWFAPWYLFWFLLLLEFGLGVVLLIPTHTSCGCGWIHGLSSHVSAVVSASRVLLLSSCTVVSIAAHFPSSPLF